jgi:hypothetical protein
MIEDFCDKDSLALGSAEDIRHPTSKNMIFYQPISKNSVPKPALNFSNSLILKAKPGGPTNRNHAPATTKRSSSSFSSGANIFHQQPNCSQAMSKCPKKQFNYLNLKPAASTSLFGPTSCAQDSRNGIKIEKKIRLNYLASSRPIGLNPSSCLNPNMLNFGTLC